MTVRGSSLRLLVVRGLRLEAEHSEFQPPTSSEAILKPLTAKALASNPEPLNLCGLIDLNISC
jgi:hypothetical protein